MALHSDSYAHRFCGLGIWRWHSRKSLSLLHTVWSFGWEDSMAGGGFLTGDRDDLKIHSPTSLGWKSLKILVMWSTLLWRLASSQHGGLLDTVATTAEGSKNKVPANQAETALPFITLKSRQTPLQPHSISYQPTLLRRRKP